MIEFDKPDNLVEMFEESAIRYADREWLGTKDSAQVYRWITYRQAASRVDAIRAGLALLEVGPGDAVGIIANNRVEWALLCYATYGRVARFVPMYEAELPQIWKYIVRDSGTRVLFVSNAHIYERVRGFLDEIPTLRHIVRLDGEGEGTLAQLEAVGRAKPVASMRPRAENIAGLIYTSGTTGDPKGVLLSHGNLTSNVHGIVRAIEPDGKENTLLSKQTRTLSFLPWAHSYGQTAELHVLMRVGGSTGFAESPETIVDDIGRIKPTFLVAVPRVFNRVYDGIQARMKAKAGLVRALFDVGLRAAEQRRALQAEGKRSLWNSLAFAVADQIVFRKIRSRIGGRLEGAVSSSAALSPHIARFFFDIGIPIYEAWGMTELSPAGTLNTPWAFKVGSAGRPLDKVRLQIDTSVVEPGARDGELVVYGPNVMQGYHGKPEATQETLTEDGGLRTGDRAFIDADGFLFITGRIKEQFKLENGKFVSPAAIEEHIKLLPLVENAMIYGLNRPYTVCLVVPDFAVLVPWARERDLPVEPEVLAKRPEVQGLYEEEIKAQLRGRFGSYEIPKRILVLADGFSTDNGMLTPTLKLKRRKVLERYQTAIEELYTATS